MPKASSPSEGGSTKREKQTALGDDSAGDSVDGNSVVDANMKT